MKQILLVIFICLFSVACSTTTNRDTGMVIGGVLGGALGHQVGGGTGKVAATIAGTLLGAAIGGRVGQSMDDVDRMKVGATLENTRTGVPSRWQNPDTGNQYKVVPNRTYKIGETDCRDYTVYGYIDGRKEAIKGTACRINGEWINQWILFHEKKTAQNVRSFLV